jgi:four helix bundle protein
MKEDNKIRDLSKDFALRIVKMYQHLLEYKDISPISKQVLRSGTSIGANISESIYAQSRPDFINKLSIALKEASETEYWLELLHDSGYLTDKEYQSIIADNKYIIGTLVNIIKSSKD